MVQGLGLKVKGAAFKLQLLPEAYRVEGLRLRGNGGGFWPRPSLFSAFDVHAG